MSARHSPCRIKMALLHADNLTHRSIFQTLGGQVRLSRSLDVLFKYASGFTAPRARFGTLSPIPPPYYRGGMGERDRETVMNNAG